LSHNFEAVHGFCFGVNAIKPIILMSAVADGKMTAAEAIKLSRLELEYLELHDTNTWVAAEAISIHFNTSEHRSKTKWSHQNQFHHSHPQTFKKDQKTLEMQ